ncbi:MAG: DUF3307 domain-containing protein [Sulfitobacter sp.]|nr:DUF3307 domain-containing protein [Sulfitobacter sp.]
MIAPVQTALILLALLQVKHLFADFFLQTPRMLMARGRFLHLGRLQHVALHAGLSLLIFLALGVPLILSVVICGIELLLHYVIDFLKGRHAELTQYGPDDAGYWRAFGADQLAHQLTYLAIIWGWAVFAT